MKIFKITLMVSAAVLIALLAVRGFDVSAVEQVSAGTTANLQEMPLLTGDLWQKMSQDEKVAFVWGMGHVVTMERGSGPSQPGREGFAMRLSTGMAGVPMNNIVSEVDGYYRENPGKVADPVIKVIWNKLVQPKMKSSSVK